MIILFASYVISAVMFFLYSFTQIDLGLTVTRHPLIYPYQRWFQDIGYFNRPLSAVLFLALVFLFFTLYFFVLYAVYKNKIKRKYIWMILLAVTFLLTFSYNAFSYDLFNYLFDAKIVTYYHQNPYMHKALDFPNDPMLSFMHWIHRTYPYGPVWLVLTVPLSFVGFGYFVPTLFLFKALTAISFLGTAFFIEKIGKIISSKYALFTTVFFALNPLALTESVISAHNDIVMIFFAMSGLYFLLNKQFFKAFLLLLLSIGLKFATVFLLPVFIWIMFFAQKKKSISWETVFLTAIILMLFATLAATIRTTFQPWYLLYILPFIALLSHKFGFLVFGSLLSLYGLLFYAPFLCFGDWHHQSAGYLFSCFSSFIK